MGKCINRGEEKNNKPWTAGRHTKLYNQSKAIFSFPASIFAITPQQQIPAKRG
jgi:hypothetical protein